MEDQQDIERALGSHFPLVLIETHEEKRVLVALEHALKKTIKPLYQWSITEGLRRADKMYAEQQLVSEPLQVLKFISEDSSNNIYLLLDFHPYLENSVHIRLLKEFCQNSVGSKIILLSHRLEVPAELKSYCVECKLSVPKLEKVDQVVRKIANEWAEKNQGKKVKADPDSLKLLIQNLLGLGLADVERFARSAIFDDGAITACDIQEVMSAKYRVLEKGGAISFEYDTSKFKDVAGLENLKNWLHRRKSAFSGETKGFKVDPPKGLVLLGVQGCGKSLAAKAIAGMWGVPLLRFDFGALYDKYVGASEKNLRASLETAEKLSPCVLWIDEIEKGLSVHDHDGGASQRILGMLLTWMAEQKDNVFVVATANDIERLPPELLRKGRFDEIFFVDLPSAEVRKEIFRIHLEKREIDQSKFDLDQLVKESEGFSGAEIEQAIVSMLYAVLAEEKELGTAGLVDEIHKTKPLSVVMGDKIEALREWARERTVPA